jgi:uncharacterized membrane protein
MSGAIADSARRERRPGPWSWTRERAGALVFGIGLGALLDGFVLHQLLQWHHLWSSRTTMATVEGLEHNTLADGIFHVAFLLVLVVGVAMLAGRRLRVRETLGLVLVGWGTFHVIDQLVFHLALGAHHIREGVDNYQLYDWGFFAIGLLLIAAGVAVVRRSRHVPAAPAGR